MNVAFDSWIPVVTQSGKRKQVSLCDVLTNGSDFADLVVRPHERVSLMRLFLCVTHAAIKGPKDYKEWKKVPARLPGATRKYLKEWKDSFELFHKKKPWLQAAMISKSASGKQSEKEFEDWTPVSKLNFAFATGNNSTLFDHGGVSDARNVPLEETVVSMLAFQCFSPGGLISQVYWNRKQSKKTSKDAPCVPASMVHAFLRGKSLRETIHLNLPTYEDIKLNYDKRDIGRPVWEMVPTSFADSKPIENATATYLGRLVPMTRLIRLHPSCERMLLGDGLVYPTFTDGFPSEPTATVLIRKTEKKEERAVLSYRPSKALWRELSAIIVKRRAGEAGGPLALQSIQDADECDIIVGALARDQATIVDTTESVFHVSSRLRSPKGTSTYEAEVKEAENLASRLGWAVEVYRQEIDHGWEGRLKSAGASKGELKAKLHSIATTHYWTAVEKNLSLLLAHIEAIDNEGAIPTLHVWQKMLYKTALDAYRVACGQETPRQMRAFAKGWQRLTMPKEESAVITKQTKEEIV
ncbi:MAG TPA: type I-E CRISPR-associated protein Cse1/CasA [Candidatus Kryptonia bacterium]